MTFIRETLNYFLTRLLRCIDKYQYFFCIDISILDFSINGNIENIDFFQFFDKQLFFSGYIIIIMTFMNANMLLVLTENLYPTSLKYAQ